MLHRSFPLFLMGECSGVDISGEAGCRGEPLSPAFLSEASTKVCSGQKSAGVPYLCSKEHGPQSLDGFAISRVQRKFRSHVASATGYRHTVAHDSRRGPETSAWGIDKCTEAEKSSVRIPDRSQTAQTR